MKCILAAVCIFLVSPVLAQVSVTGKLADPDTQKPLSRATVSIYDARDTSLLACRLSKYGGDFTLPDIPLRIPCTMIVYDSGYAVYRKTFTLTGNETFDVGNILLAPEVQPLEEALTYAERPPVIVHKNNIEFSGLIFKYLPNTVGIGLLKKLPGIVVSADGTVMANGEKIKKIFLDEMSLISSLQ